MWASIVAQGLKVAHTFHGVQYGFFVVDPAAAQGNIQGKALGDDAAQHLQLDLTHDLQVDLLQPVIPDQVQLRIFLLQLPQLGQDSEGVGTLGKLHPVGHHRFQDGCLGPGLCPKALSGKGGREACDGTQLAGEHRFRGGEFICRVQPQLHGFFFYSFTL